LQADGPRAKAIGEYLIGNIDGNGYLRIAVDQAAASLGVSGQEVSQVLALVQQFEPTGVAARNLAECLLLQLGKAGKLTPLLERL
ncbi:hypothetical protein NE624_18000, partial [Alistipes onderdonkii]|nr:hypothetical protein [Alistipes onderdonkii]